MWREKTIRQKVSRLAKMLAEAGLLDVHPVTATVEVLFYCKMCGSPERLHEHGTSNSQVFVYSFSWDYSKNLDEKYHIVPPLLCYDIMCYSCHARVQAKLHKITVVDPAIKEKRAVEKELKEYRRSLKHAKRMFAIGKSVGNITLTE